MTADGQVRVAAGGASVPAPGSSAAAPDRSAAAPSASAPDPSDAASEQSTVAPDPSAALLEERVAAIAAGYSPGAPAVTAQALRELWLGFTPNRGVELIKAEQRAQYEAAGIPIPVLKAIGRQLAGRAREDVDGYLPLARLLWDEYGREGRVVALIVFGALELAAPETVVPLLRECCRGCVSWEDADRLAMDALEPVVRKRPDEWLERISPWLEDDSPWVRRAGITVVARLPMKHSECTARCLSLTAGLLCDAEPDVRRAVSFSIRMCAKADPVLVRGFLEDHVPGAGAAAVWVLCDAVRSADRKVVPALLPLLPRYEAWLEDPEIGVRDRRSLESAVKVLGAAR